MKKSYAQKIQALLIAHLLNKGEIELLLPDGMRVEIKITEETKNGPEICENYCCVKTSRQEMSTMLDAYSMVIEYADRDKKILCFDHTTDEDGQEIRRMEVV